MPILRPKKSVPAPKAREVRTASGTHVIRRERPREPPTTGFSEEEVPTGRLGMTQLRRLVERSADPEVTARTLPVAIPVPAAAVAPTVEEAPAIAADPVLILIEQPSDAPEIEIIGDLETSAAFPLVVSTNPLAGRPSPRRAHVSEPVEFAKNVLGHGFIVRRLLGIMLLAALVATAAWTAGGH
jgi:hypothetical protein